MGYLNLEQYQQEWRRIETLADRLYTLLDLVQIFAVLPPASLDGDHLVGLKIKCHFVCVCVRFCLFCKEKMS